MFEFKPITNSSSLSAWHYDPAQRVLSLRFNRSDFIYHFQNVDPELAQRFDAAESKGSFFAGHIKGKFESARVNTADGPDAQAEPSQTESHQARA